MSGDGQVPYISRGLLQVLYGICLLRPLPRKPGTAEATTCLQGLLRTGQEVHLLNYVCYSSTGSDTCHHGGTPL